MEKNTSYKLPVLLVTNGESKTECSYLITVTWKEEKMKTIILTL